MNSFALSSLVLFQLVASHGRTATEPAAAAGGLSWSVPKGWSAAPSSSSMRVATYRVPAIAGDSEPAEVGVFFFGKVQGGSVESNVARWFGQFHPEAGAAPAAKPRKIQVGSADVTLVATEGTYESGMPGMGASGPKPHWGLYGAIAQGPDGMVFFKMVGPKKTVAHARAEMDALIKSLSRSSIK